MRRLPQRMAVAIITFAIGLWTVNQHHDVEILSSSSNKTGRKDEEKELHSDSVHGRVRNPTTSDASPLCTAEQMHKITHQLMLTKDKNINNIDTSKLKSCRLSGWFKCPKTSWLDNFYAEETDIVGSVEMGYKSVLVLSGGTKKEDLDNFAYCPEMVVDSVADLLELPELQMQQEAAVV